MKNTPPHQDILSPSGRFAEINKAYEDRPGQRQMAKHVADAIAHDGTLLIEAGTGIGKTLAYLVPALQSGKQVVVSTGTKTLQNQIIERDVPMLRRILPNAFSAALLKGVSNYVCLRKAHQSFISADPTISLWKKQTQYGELSELPQTLQKRFKSLSTTSESRMGSSCDYYDQCFVTKARRFADEANLIVVNHHLLCSDLAMKQHTGGGRVLPDYDVLIVDEAHQFEDIFTTYLGISISTGRFAHFAKDLIESTEKHADLCGGLWGENEGKRYAKRLREYSDALFAGCRKALAQHTSGERFELPDGIFTGGIQQAWFDLDELMDQLQQFLQLRSAALHEKNEKDSFATLSARSQRLRDALAHIAESKHQEDTVRWGEILPDSVSLQSSPLSVASAIQSHVVRPGRAVVFTSATLTTNQSFEYIQHRLGLLDAETHTIPSPFNYESNCLMYIARDLPEPSLDGSPPEQHARMQTLLDITKGNAFILFTSHRALKLAAHALKSTNSHPLLVQGDAPRGQLLETFRRTPHAVLLGTNTFWEGVDMPGQALSQVIIDRLPFQNPSDPLCQSRMKRLSKEGLDPFSTSSIAAGNTCPKTRDRPSFETAIGHRHHLHS